MLNVLINIELAETILSERLLVQNGLFVLFLLCFIILASVMGRNPMLVKTIFRSLFNNSEIETSGSGVSSGKLLLSFQSVILLALSTFCYVRHQCAIDMPLLLSAKTFGVIALAIAACFVYKIVSTAIIGYIFFSKEQTRLWNSSFSSIICLCGIFLFVPTLLMCFMDKFFLIGFYFNLICIIFFLILLTYKTFVIFFRRIYTFLYFILYLCAQEIIPLYFLYKGISKGIDYLFIF